MTFLLANWRLLILGSLLLVLGIQTWRLDRCKTGWHDYEVAVQALGQAQLAENERIAREREKAAKEAVNALKKSNMDLAARYADARRRLRDDPGPGAVPTLASAAAAACPSPDADLTRRLADLEKAFLDLAERHDAERLKYLALWEWANRVP